MMGRMYPDAFPRRWPTLQDSILAMFAGGVPGAWYDPSDLASMQQNYIAETPILTSGQPIGLILDKSRGLAQTPNQVTDPDTGPMTPGGTSPPTFATTTHLGQPCREFVFNLPAGPGGLGVSNAISSVTGSVPAGTLRFALQISFSRALTGSEQIQLYTSNPSDVYSRLFSASNTAEAVGAWVNVLCYKPAVSSGTASFTIYAPGTWPGGSPVTVYVRQVQINTVLGNAAFQTTAGSRPIYRVENYNALTFTRDFTNAAWSKTNANVTANTWVPTSGSPELLRAAAVVVTAGQRFTISGTFKPIGDAVGVILYSTQGGNGFELKVNLLTGKLISWGTLGTGVLNDYAISGNPIDGWTLYASGGLDPAGTNAQWRVKLCDAAGLGVTANSVDGLQIDGAQLVLGANAFRPYQWVDASGTFDQSQGRRYLQFDGVDDWLRAAFTITQPFYRVSGIRQTTWTSGDQIFGGAAANSGVYFQTGLTPTLGLNSGFTAAGNGSLAIGEVGITTELHDGANSSNEIEGITSTGNAGTNLGGGITVGASNTALGPSNFDWFGTIMRQGALDASRLAVAKRFEAAKAGVTL